MKQLLKLAWPFFFLFPPKIYLLLGASHASK